MTRNEFRQVYKSWYGEMYCSMFWKVHREELMKMHSLYFTPVLVRELNWLEPNYVYNGLNYEDNMKILKDYILGNCTAATPIFPSENISYGEAWINQEKGNNPMRTYEYNTPIASASVINAKSDEAYQREYLLSELENTRYNGKYGELRRLFNLDTDNRPSTAEELIEKITKGQYKLDEKKLAKMKESFEDDDEDGEYYPGYGGPFYGIIFDGPKPDRKGYDAAIADYCKAQENTKRKIIVGTPAEGLQALLDLEAWLPTGKAN